MFLRNCIPSNIQHSMSQTHGVAVCGHVLEVLECLNFNWPSVYTATPCCILVCDNHVSFFFGVNHLMDICYIFT